MGSGGTPTPTASGSVATMLGGDGQKFRLIAELGRGGMATVYLAVASGPAGFNKLIVVKCLRPSLAAEPEFLEMFLAEARLAARINHPNVIQTNEVGHDGRFYYIIMEYVEGRPLHTIVRKAPQFPVNLHLYVIMQVLAGLHHAHELKDFEGQPLNVVHRDISPQNIMVSYDGQVKLLDFGIAKAADSGGNTRTGILKGKCAYMAAEQFGGHNVDRRADVFAAGVCLWQAITGTKLWRGLSDAEIFSHVSHGDIPSPRTVNPDLPNELVDICLRALGPRPADRFATAAEFLAALEDFVAQHAEYRATSRELAKYIGDLFATERTKMQESVDEQLRQSATSGSRLVRLSPESSLGTLTPAPGSNEQPTRRSPLVLIAGVAGIAVIAVLTLVLALRGRSRSGDGDTSTQVTSQVSVHVEPDSAKIFFDDAPLSGNPAMATFTRDGVAHRIRAEAPDYLRKTELVVLDSAKVNVELRLEPDTKDDDSTTMEASASPPNARIFLDNAPLQGNPFNGKYPRDGKTHQLRAEAPGFVSKTTTVKFDGPKTSFSTNLDRDFRAMAVPVRTPKPPVHVDTGERPAPPLPPPPPPSSAPKSTAKGLDRSDPYAN